MKKLIIVIPIMFLLLWTAKAAVPRLINYQGRLTDKEGKPLNGVTKEVTFRIYDAEAGNGEMMPWEETHQVNVQGGGFSVILGSLTPLNLPFDKPYFLEIQVGDEVMGPRQQLTSVGYAIRAESVEKIQDYKAEELLDRRNHTGTQPPATISPQGSGSGLDADTIDGKHLSEIETLGFCFGANSGLARETGWDISAKFRKMKGLNYVKVNFNIDNALNPGAVLGGGGVGVKLECNGISKRIEIRRHGPYSLVLDISSFIDGQIYSVRSYGGVIRHDSRIDVSNIIFTHE